MPSDLRAVIDTNVIVSALLLKHSVPRQAFDLARQRGAILLSWPTIAELNDVLSRPRFDRYVMEDECRQFVAALVGELGLVPT